MASWLSSAAEMSLFNVKSGFLGQDWSKLSTVILAYNRSTWANPIATADALALLLAEAVVRGYKLGLLTSADYNNLSQCETLDDIKLYLVRRSAFVLRFSPANFLLCIPLVTYICPSLQTGTDYGPFVANEPSPLQTSSLVDACTRKLVDDWRYLRENAGEPLGRFLDYCTYGHMIDNVVLIVTGTLHERDVQELLEKCHPLGMFDSLASLAVAQNIRDLYRLVLVDTPLAPYFSEHLSSEDLDEMNVEILRNTLYKAYLDDFAKFCATLGGSTAEAMGDMLAFEADRRALNITLNSIGTELTRDDRRRLYSNFGLLYPHGQAELAAAEDFDGVRAAMERVPAYTALFSRLGAGEAQVLDKVLYEEEVRRAVSAFDQQFHFGVFYSYMALREQEVRNVMWIAECVAQDQKSRILDGVVFTI